MVGPTSPLSAAATVQVRMARFREVFEALRTSLGQVIVGHEEVIQQVLIGLIAGGHILLEGVPGIGKTLLVKTLASTLDLDFARIQFTPDLMPADIIGTQVLARRTDAPPRFEFQPGPIFGQIVLADEINRATPKTQSALLEAMEEATVTVARVPHPLPRPFFVLATQNPLEMEGTYPLPEAQLDRFLFKILVHNSNVEELEQILARVAGSERTELTKVAEADEILQMQRLAADVVLPASLGRTIARIVAATHPNHDEATARCSRYVKYGSSPRGALAVARSAKVAALASGRPHVNEADVLGVCFPALRHRIALNFEGVADEVREEDLLREVLANLGLT